MPPTTLTPEDQAQIRVYTAQLRAAADRIEADIAAAPLVFPGAGVGIFQALEAAGRLAYKIGFELGEQGSGA